jgi:hypothetical protein
MRPGIGAVLPRAALHAHRRGAGDAREPARQRAEAAAHRRAVPRGQPRLVRAPGLSRRGGARAGADPGCGPRVRAYARRATRGHPGRAPLACGARGAQRSDAARPCRLCASTLKVPRVAAHWLAAAHAATHRIHRSGSPPSRLLRAAPLGQRRAPAALWCLAQSRRFHRLWPPKVCGALRRGTSS